MDEVVGMFLSYIFDCEIVDKREKVTGLDSCFQRDRVRVTLEHSQRWRGVLEYS